MPIRDSGTDQERKSGGRSVRSSSPTLPPSLTLIQKGRELQLLADFTFDTDRKIKGCAHFPTIDKENELILSEAIRKALPQYMQHPILHIQHTERPVGTVTKAEIDAEGALLIEGTIFDTPDTNDVWGDIQNGLLNKFSIFGRREQGSYECSLHPDQRSSPCVTKALTLFSISIVGENAMNSKTFLEVAKGGDITEETDEKEEVEKCNDSRTEMKAEESNISSVLGRLGKIEETLSQLVESDKQVHSSMEKSEDETLTETEKKEEKEEKVEKAAIDPKPEFIVKATMDSEIKKAVDEVRKAYDEKFSVIEKAHTELKETVEKMKKETIEKGGNVVIIEKKQIDENLKLGQIDLIGDVV